MFKPPQVIFYLPFQCGGSGVVSVVCFGVRVSVMFHLMFVHFTFSSVWVAEGHLLGNSCPLGLPYVLIVFCLLVTCFYIPFCFKSGLGLLIAPVPVHCFSITYGIQFILSKHLS